MHHIRAMPARLKQGNKGVHNSLKTLPSWSKTIDQSDSAPLISLLSDITASGKEKNIMPSGSNAREELLAVFFHTSRDVRNASRACDKDFHGLAISAMRILST